MKKDKAKKVESKKVFGSENSHNLFEYMNEGVCLHKIIYGEKEKPIDYKVLDVNPAYEKIIGIKKEDVQNQIASDLYGTGEAPFLDIYSRVAETGNPESFEIFWPPLQKHFLISVFLLWHQSISILSSFLQQDSCELFYHGYRWQ